MVEQRSPKPLVACSNRVSPASVRFSERSVALQGDEIVRFFVILLYDFYTVQSAVFAAFDDAISNNFQT